MGYLHSAAVLLRSREQVNAAILNFITVIVEQMNQTEDNKTALYVGEHDQL
jgi:hypothetical protein